MLCTVTVVLPETDVVCVLVAVTVAFPAVLGAVSNPAALIVPALALHVTAELYDPVPVTLALHCEVAPGATVAGLQLTETAVTVAEPPDPDPPVVDGAELDPHPVTTTPAIASAATVPQNRSPEETHPARRPPIETPAFIASLDASSRGSR